MGWIGVPVATIASLLVAGVAVKTYRQSGWTFAAEIQLAKSAVVALGACVFLRQFRFRYVFEQGTVRAYNTWGLMWSENLTGVVGVRYMRERTTPTLEVSWPDRMRRIELFRSLRYELDKLVDAAKPPTNDSVDEEEDNGVPWICPACHEENPGNFGECWKCQKVRESESGPVT